MATRSNSEVTTWYMTEEQRLAYIAKHPITGKKKETGFNYKDYRDQTKQRHEAAREAKEG